MGNWRKEKYVEELGRRKGVREWKRGESWEGGERKTDIGLVDWGRMPVESGSKRLNSRQKCSSGKRDGKSGKGKECKEGRKGWMAIRTV